MRLRHDETRRADARVGAWGGGSVTLAMVPRSVGRLFASFGASRVLPVPMPVGIPPVGLIRPRDRILPPRAMLLLETLTEAIETRPPEPE